MPTFEINLSGIVQGVGFRPYVYRFAKENNLTGWVINGSNGVRFKFNAADEDCANEIFSSIVKSPPKLARIDSCSIQPVAEEQFNSFSIRESLDNGVATIPVTPDFALCEACRSEVTDTENRRVGYPFITCTLCGPRYSITNGIPYDRHRTTMDKFKMCKACEEEYNEIINRRYFSQTNSCSTCGIELEVHDSKNSECLNLSKSIEILSFATEQLRKGKIIALKGIGGFLLLCDANNDSAVKSLRQRKVRPDKPFAVVYSDTDAIETDYVLKEEEKELISGPVAPIVLLTPGETTRLSCQVAPNLDQIGVMHAYAPVLYLISKQFDGPLIATSGNVSGSPIIYENGSALKELSDIADYVIINNRDIVVPQDDSVVRFTPKTRHQIILRRSRGMAPNYYNNQIDFNEINGVLATGAEMKGAFGLVHQGNCYISQYLGDMSGLYSQESFEKVFNHLQKTLGFQPQILLSDSHPAYFSHQWSQRNAQKRNIDWNTFQHHEAHFASVLGEHRLLDSVEPILGFIWDGTGLSPDKHIWGSELFRYEKGVLNHLDNVGYVKNLSGDKMAREPRLSLLSFSNKEEDLNEFVRHRFSPQEWAVLMKHKEVQKLRSSSMGRLFDAVSCLLTNTNTTSFEGQASMYLEQLATDSWNTDTSVPQLDFTLQEAPFALILDGVYKDLRQEIESGIVAFRFHHYLLQWIVFLIEKHRVKHAAFSGGVFQNALLIDLIKMTLSDRYQLYFNNDLSPNDENIAFGQLMLELINRKTKRP